MKKGGKWESDQPLMTSKGYLRNSDEVYQSIFEHSMEAILLTGTDGSVFSANPAACKMFGMSEEEICRLGRAGLVDNSDPRLKTGLEYRDRCGSVLGELTMIRKNGERFPVEISSTIFLNHSGEERTSIIIRDISELRKSDENLRKSNELLEKLNRHQNEIRENERALISREVHDELGQTLTVLKLDLFMLKNYVSNNTEAVLKLEKMIALISSAMTIVHRISSDLRPEILDDLGLVAAIEWYCDEFENRTGLKCSLKLDNCDLINSQIKLTFFRVLQESLTNVIRHSGASAVNLELHNSRKGTTLTIHDNGIGIAKEKIDSYNSMGLLNIRERVRQFNGKASFLSKPGKGTKLSIFIPS